MKLHTERLCYTSRLVVLSLLLSMPLTGVFAQQVRSIDASWIQQLKDSKSDTLYVVNFWATWCKPCVEEIHLFDSICTEYAGDKLKVVLVSNDMKKDAETKLPAFIAEQNLKPEVVWMSDLNADNWINTVDPTWSGAIPATWILKNNMAFSYFKEGEISLKELKLIIDQIVDLK